MFDERAVRELGWSKIPKDDYTNAMLSELHAARQKIIDDFVEHSRKPIIFFGHHLEADNETRIPTSTRILLDVSPETAAVNAMKRPGKSSEDVLRDLRTGREDVRDLKARGYVAASPRRVYGMVKQMAGRA